MKLSEILTTLLREESLTTEKARQVMEHFMSGEATPVEVASILVALQAKGVSPQELAAFGMVLREHCVALEGEEDAMDSCGTGGGIPTFNLSTASAIVLAACGVKVAKHGNRGVTSKCGSADVLETLGIKVEVEAGEAKRMLNTLGITFLYAPKYHPAMRHVGPVRRELGVRSVFNLLGPMVNPAKVKRQVIGVYEPSHTTVLAEALLAMGLEKGCVVHGMDGLDEVSPCAPTQIVWIERSGIRSQVVSPEDFGLEILPFKAMAPSETLEGSAEAIQEAVSDVSSQRALALLPNVATCLVVAGVTNDFKEAANIGKEAIRDGRAVKVLESWVNWK